VKKIKTLHYVGVGKSLCRLGYTVDGRRTGVRFLATTYVRPPLRSLPTSYPVRTGEPSLGWSGIFI